MIQTAFQSNTCIFCGASALKTLVPSNVLPERLSVLKCPSCSLVFLESRAASGELDREEAVYWDDGDQKKIYLEDKIQDLFAVEFKSRLKTLEQYAPNRGKLLDVGCGVGHFLAIAEKRGWKTQGLDISQAASRAAHEAYGLDVQVGTLENSNLLPPHFDAITLWDVIEHIRRPVENVRAANHLLRKGGIIVMKTPNESGLFKQFVLALYKMFGNRTAFLLKYVYYVPHYFSYSKQSMSFLLNSSGFEVIRYETDETPQEFAAEKIEVHYKKDPKHSKIIALLPIARFFARLFGKGNKMIIYARKVREA